MPTYDWFLGPPCTIGLTFPFPTTGPSDLVYTHVSFARFGALIPLKSIEEKNHIGHFVGAWKTPIIHVRYSCLYLAFYGKCIGKYTIHRLLKHLKWKDDFV